VSALDASVSATSRWRTPRAVTATRRSGIAVLLAPAMLLVGVFYILPLVLNFVYAFTDWSTYKSSVNYVGAENFKDLSSAGDLGAAVKTTAEFAVIVMVVQNVVSLSLALALEKTSRINGVFRTIFFIPVLIAPLAAGYLFQGLLAPDGFANRALSTITGHHVEVAWLGSTSFTLIIVALIWVWKFCGIHMLVYLAALNAVPRELLEAARVEGCGPWWRFRKVKVPLIGPAFTFNVTLSLIGALSAFDVIIATTNGGPGSTTKLMNLYVFQAYSTGTFGYATALSLVLFAAILILAIPLISVLRRREVEL
jgi:raffinose/stachyose/melibiose transport system permease protein